MVVAFSSRARILGECSTIHSPPALFFLLKWLAHTNSTLYAMISPQWLSELRRLWPSVHWRVVCEFASWSVPTLCLDSGIVSPLRLRRVKGECVFKFNLLPALLAEWPGSLYATAVTRGWNRHWIRVSTQSWFWRRKFSCRFCRDSNSQPFDHESGALTNKLFRLP